MNEIKVSDTLKDISSRLEWKEAGVFLAPGSGPMSDMTLEQFAGISCWNARSMAEGYNRLLELAQNGDRFYYPLWTEEETQQEPAKKERYLTRFSVEKKAPFVIVCAGGGYMGCASMVEAFPTCVHLNREGYHAFVLNYRCNENAKAPNPLDDMACALKYILEHAQELNVEIQGYAVCGFSAGGHLAACFGTESVGWKHYGLPKPGAVFLAYPVITLGEKSHESTRQMFLGTEDDMCTEMIERYSVNYQVTEYYPPTYLWQCSKDNTVPIENSRMMADALRRYGVPFVYETFDSDCHGWGSGDETLAAGWIERAVEFWKRYSLNIPQTPETV